MSRLGSPARTALRTALADGLSGTYEALASLTGVTPDAAQAALKELSRTGHARAIERQRRAGRAGASPAVYAAYQPPLDALGFALRVWR
jgi:hypothetical protein